MVIAKRIFRTATEGLKHIWEEKFFEKPRKMGEVEENFSKRHHHFADSELAMALKRAKYLTRGGKKGNYTYIQKHPYLDEGRDERPKNNTRNKRNKKNTKKP